MAPLPDVAAAHIVVPSAPTKLIRDTDISDSLSKADLISRSFMSQEYTLWNKVTSGVIDVREIVSRKPWSSKLDFPRVLGSEARGRAHEAIGKNKYEKEQLNILLKRSISHGSLRVVLWVLRNLGHAPPICF